MFGFQSGETLATVERKRGYMKDAQKRWPFMTNDDLSTITSATQLQQVVRVRLGVSEKLAADDVQSWMLGKDFSTSPRSFVSAQEPTASISRWDNEGGAANKNINIEDD